MRFHRQHEQRDNTEVSKLIKETATGTLITFQETTEIRIGIYNVLEQSGKFYIHIGRSDEQAIDMDSNNRCFLVFQDILSTIPSYWTDRRYGGAINQFFRFAQFECTARTIENGDEMKELLKPMLDRFQKEQIYDPLDPESEIYKQKFLAIRVVELTPLASRTKWNLGQTKPIAAFRNILTELRNRNGDVDHQTANEMERWYETYKTPKR